MSSQFDPLIFAAGARHGVDPAFIKAVVKAESNFNPRAYRFEPHVAHLGGPDASYGLMQTLFSTAKELGYTGTPEGLYDPATSLEFGTRYLKRQLSRYGGDVEKAAAAYNAGSAIRSNDGRGWINQAYVDRVLRFFREFRTVQPEPAVRSAPPAITFPPVRVAAGEDELGRRLIQLETLLTPQSAPYVIGGLAVLGALIFSGGDRRR